MADDWLRDEFEPAIATLDLTEEQKLFLRTRWLGQVVWMEGKAGDCQRRHNRLRVTIIGGAVLIPALTSLQALGGSGGDVATVVSIVLATVVAASAAVEQFFDFGGRWRHYRQTVETLKSEGWSFVQQIAPYAAATHRESYPAFATRVEQLLLSDVQEFVTQVAVEKEPPPESPA